MTTNLEQERHDRQQSREDYRWLLSNEAGRRIASQILRWSQVDATGPLGGELDMAIATGKRVVGNMLRDQLARFAPEQWGEMQAQQARLLSEADEVAWRADFEQRQRMFANGLSGVAAGEQL